MYKIKALPHFSYELHKYCIDENGLVFHEKTKVDYVYSSITSSIPLVNDSDRSTKPVEMLNGRDHYDDCNLWRASSSNASRERMLKTVIEKDLHRIVSMIKK